jgi:hypothetical protein
VLSQRDTWRTKAGQELPYGPSLKLPNLVAKHLCVCAKADEADTRRIAKFLHVPLDSYTIVALNNCISDMKAAAPNIPTGATMGFISTAESYWEFQYRIRDLAAEAGVPPIAFDVVCWNAAHDAK